MAHRRDRISIRNPKEGVRGLAFEMVLYGRRPLPDPVRIGLPEFVNAPLKKRRSWRQQSSLRKMTGTFFT